MTPPRRPAPEDIPLAARVAAYREDTIFDASVRGQALRFRTTWGLFSPREVDEGTSLLLDAIAGPVRVSDGNEKRIADLGADIARTTGIAAFWRRMVLLHGDAAIVALQSPDLVPPEGRRPSLVNGRVVAAPMIALERDGEIVGSMSPNWNWAVVRGLLDLRWEDYWKELA